MSSRTVSVVIPTRDSALVIGRCLESICNQSRRPDEIIVCDGGSSDQTREIADSSGAIVIEAAPNRSAQRNLGAAKASGDYLLFIDSDMRLSSRVIEDCLSTMTETDAALVIPEIFVGEGFWAKVRGFERSFYDGIWWIEAARWYRASQFNEIGGFDEGMIGPEDWDLDQRIRQFGEVRWITAYIDHDEGRVAFRRLLQKKAHYSGSMSRFAERHPERAGLALSPARRAALFARHPARLVAHPVMTCATVTLGLVEAVISKGWVTRWNTDLKERVRI